MSVAIPIMTTPVGEFLQSPDDLSKLSALRQRLVNEKASLDVRLQNGIKEQLDVTRDGLRKLFSTQMILQGIWDAVDRANDIDEETESARSEFEQISRVRHDLKCHSLVGAFAYCITGVEGTSQLRED